MLPLLLLLLRAEAKDGKNKQNKRSGMNIRVVRSEMMIWYRNPTSSKSRVAMKKLWSRGSKDFKNKCVRADLRVKQRRNSRQVRVSSAGAALARAFAVAVVGAQRAKRMRMKLK